MVVEYILLLSAFVIILLKVTYFAPLKAFEQAGPRLGARIEKHLTTGRGFSENSVIPILWQEKP